MRDDVTPCQLYVVVAAGPTALERLMAVLAEVAVAAVLVTPAAGKALTVDAAKPLVALIQSRSVAALVVDDPALARTLRADGVHLTAATDSLERYHAARAIVGGDISIGVDAGGSRHRAMELGEAGADYVAFGKATVELARTDADDGEPGPSDPTLAGPTTPADLVAWWAEVFEVPCVAFDIADVAAARQAATRGADFIAVHLPAAVPLATLVADVRALAGAMEDDDAA
jgi:thiamine-phosphate pyrophosphorylase